MMLIFDFGALNSLASRAIRALFALPSTGGAVAGPAAPGPR